jgi:hypothetical protein
VTAEVELKASIRKSCGQAANIAIPLENRDMRSVRAQLVSCGQARGAAAEDDDVLWVCYFGCPV